MHRKRQTESASSRALPNFGAMQAVFEKGFTYSRRLIAHKSCVNSLKFSSGDGRWLASAGDDLRVLLWDFHQENIEYPSCYFLGHRANIFCLGFSSNNQYIYSGACDEQIMKFDLSRASSGASEQAAPGSPCQVFTDHSGSIRGLSCHPSNDEIFLSASEDGTVVLHDSRTHDSASRASGHLRNSFEFTDVQYHPQADHLFATSDLRGHVYLRDSRMAFTSGEITSSKGSVLEYVTSITRKSVPHLCRPEVSSLAFDREGKKLAVTFLHYLPTIYSISDPYPRAVCSGRLLPGGLPIPDGERTYTNSCTIKHGSFGGPGLEEDSYYSAGSDDFRAYVWKIPDLSVLEEERRKVSVEDWISEEAPTTISFAMRKMDIRYVPVHLDAPIFRMQGHRSIVNTSVIHPHLPQIVTSGVERHITLHSPTPSAPNVSSFAPTDENVRQLPDGDEESNHQFLTALIEGPRSLRTIDSSDADEEEKTLDFFDGILRQNTNVNVFTDSAHFQLSDSESDTESDFDIGSFIS